MEHFTFLNPPMKYCVHQIAHEWPENYTKQIQIYKEYGFGGLVTNAPWDDDYMVNVEKILHINDIIEHARNEKFNVWLYDEKGFPSGTAGGLTLKDHPEYKATGLLQIKVFGNGKTQHIIQLPADSIEFIYAELFMVINDSTYFDNATKIEIENNSITFTGADGEWVIYAYATKYNFEGTHAEYNGWEKRVYPNILSKIAVKHFIDVTYERYFENISKMDISIEAVFTDEPSLMAAYQNTSKEYEYAVVPWEKNVPKEFFDENRYDLLHNLHSLFEGNQIQDKMVRVNFYQTIGKMLSNSFFAQIDDWCKDHGIMMSGHALLEEHLVCHVGHYGNLYKCLRKMQMPGVDLLTTRPDRFINSPSDFLLAPKYASSAARAEGHKYVMCEICPVIGSVNGFDNDASIEEMIGTANLLYFSGVNHINSYYRYEHYTDELFARYSRYVGRLGVILKESQNLADVAIYYSIETIQAEYFPIKKEIANQKKELWDMSSYHGVLARAIYEAQSDFNFIDDEQIINSEIVAGNIKTKNYSYRTIIMPMVKVIPLAVMKKLQQFVEKDGMVVWCRCKPEMGTSADEHNEIIQISNGIHVISEMSNILAAIPKRNITLSGECKSVFIGNYSNNEKQIFFLINTKCEPIKFSVFVDHQNSAELFNPQDGSIENIMIPNEIVIDGFMSIFLIFNEYRESE